MPDLEKAFDSLISCDKTNDVAKAFDGVVYDSVVEEGQPIKPGIEHDLDINNIHIV
jgi:hypothetical protein